MQTKYLQSQIFPLKLQMLFTCNDGNCQKSCRVVTVAEIAPVLLTPHVSTDQSQHVAQKADSFILHYGVRFLERGSQNSNKLPFISDRHYASIITQITL